MPQEPEDEEAWLLSHVQQPRTALQNLRHVTESEQLWSSLRDAENRVIKLRTCRLRRDTGVLRQQPARMNKKRAARFGGSA